ncbi:hypothetical protein BDY24DRAFT_38066 [Mrakia frigida]|uniref:uncharacterized protein n=1 Tax=Mrakia frigida TaxID=29902 RepID=UPI003FCC157F
MSSWARFPRSSWSNTQLKLFFNATRVRTRGGGDPLVHNEPPKSDSGHPLAKERGKTFRTRRRKRSSLPRDLVLLFFLLSSCLLRVFVLRAEGSMLFNESSSERGNHANEKNTGRAMRERRQGQGVRGNSISKTDEKRGKKRFHCMEQRREPTKQTKEDESEL